MAKKTFPKEIYLTHEGEGDHAWMQVNITAEDAAEIGEEKTVGYYRFVGIKKVVVEVKFRW